MFFAQDHTRSSLTAAHLVQAPLDSAGHQEGSGCRGHPALHPARQVVHQREEDGRVCGVGRHERPRAGPKPRIRTHSGEVDDLQRAER